MSGVTSMARPKKQEAKKAAEPIPQGRTTIINLKGTTSQADWLEAVHRKTHIAKSVIVRLALAEWSERNGHPPFPMEDDEE
jgi:hypothetical protein